MGLFSRKKKIIQPVNYDAKVFQSTLNIFSDFGNNINASDVVKICIDRIATHTAKLKPRYVKNLNNSTIVEKNGALEAAFVLLCRFVPAGLRYVPLSGPNHCFCAAQQVTRERHIAAL